MSEAMKLLLAGFGIAAAAAWYLFKGTMSDEKPAPGSTKEDILAAIRAGIVVPMGLPQRAVDILYFHAVRETGNFKAWYFSGPQKDGLPPTYGLYNRRAGSGRGEWTHKVKMINGDDTRIYSDVYQSARDMRQRLSEYGDMKDAVAALRAGDGMAYFNALEANGFSARRGDYAAYAMQWARGIV